MFDDWREYSVKDTKMIRNLFLKILRNDIGSIEYGNEIIQKEEGEYGKVLLRNHSLSTLPSFLETFTNSP